MPYPSAKSSFETYREGNSTLEISMMVKMVLAVRGFRGQLDERLRKIGQSTSRMETLSAIMNMQGPKSQSDVAKRLRVEGATVTRMVDILSKEGLVIRAPAPTDRRVNLLSITPAGEKVLKDIFAVYDRTRNHFLADMTKDEVTAMHGVLDNMIERLNMPETAASEKAAIAIDDLPELDRLRDKIVDPETKGAGGFTPER